MENRELKTLIAALDRQTAQMTKINVLLFCIAQVLAIRAAEELPTNTGKNAICEALGALAANLEKTNLD